LGTKRSNVRAALIPSNPARKAFVYLWNLTGGAQKSPNRQIITSNSMEQLKTVDWGHLGLFMIKKCTKIGWSV
jgi:hypothetical protein